MTRRSWYLFSLWLPLLLPIMLLLISLVFAMLPGQGENGMGWTFSIAIFLIFAAAFGGVQYIAFALCVAYWARGKEAWELSKVSWVLPVLFAPVCALGLFIYVVASNDSVKTLYDAVRMVMGFSAVSILFGYFYVLLIHGLTWALARVGFIKDPAGQ